MYVRKDRKRERENEKKERTREREKEGTREREKEMWPGRWVVVPLKEKLLRLPPSSDMYVGLLGKRPLGPLAPSDTSRKGRKDCGLLSCFVAC